VQTLYIQRVFYFTFGFYCVAMSGALTALCFKTRDEVRSRGVYTQSVEEQALSGVILFLMSEAMLFAAFF